MGKKAAMPLSERNGTIRRSKRIKATRRGTGEVAEWSNAAVLKTVGRESVPRVRIPVSPPRMPVSVGFTFLALIYRVISAGCRLIFCSETTPPGAFPIVYH